MTKRDYEAIAKVLASEINDWEVGTEEFLIIARIALRLADYFEVDNPMFDREGFLVASGHRGHK